MKNYLNPTQFHICAVKSLKEQQNQSYKKKNELSNTESQVFSDRLKMFRQIWYSGD
jgi:hypothetical protein